MDGRVWRPVALAAAMVLTVSCSTRDSYAVQIPADRLEGRWVSTGGVSLTFHTDRTFTSEHLDTLHAASGCADPSGLDSGGWAFLAPTEPGGTTFAVEEAATRGSMLSLTFPDRDGSVSAYVFGDEDEPAMCPSEDPDGGCPSGYLHRSDQGE